MFPDCDRPASWCKRHHIIFWARDHGRTDLADGILLCRHHHLLHNNDWDSKRHGTNYWLIPHPTPTREREPIRMHSRSRAHTEPHQKRTGKTGGRKTGLASNADVAATATATATASKVVACPRSRRVESNRHTFRRRVAPRAWAQSDVRETATISSRGTTLMRTRPSGSPSAFSCSSSRCQPPRSVYSTPRS